LATGGQDIESNLALACRACNLRKWKFVEGQDPETGTNIRLFHPRIDLWKSHFQFDGTIGKIAGLTPIGRATVERLQINSATQVTARRQWSRIGLLP